MAKIGLALALSRVDQTRLLRICWPEPDRVCLQSGCIHCEDSLHQLRISTIAAYAEEHDWGEDFGYGLQHNWSVR